MTKITTEDQKKLLEILAVIYPKGGVTFKETEEGMPYMLVSLMDIDKNVHTRAVTWDKFLMTDVMPDIIKRISILDEEAHKWKERYLDSIKEVFENALYDYKGAPKTLIDYVYESLFDELKPRISKKTVENEQIPG